MSSIPILSIVIPTKNRHRYLAKLVRTLLHMKSHDFEVIVHDNSPVNAGYLELCGSISDVRLRYVHEPTPLSITDNCERGVGLARGSFVCMIGDDDGVTEQILQVAHWLKSSGLDAAACVVPTYLWPGVASVLDGAQSKGVLRLARHSGKVRILAEDAELERVMRTGGCRIGGLPGVYQGLVSKAALERLKALAGTYFPGPSPDMANAVGLSAVIDRFALVDFPIVISGSCPSSGAAEGARHGHRGEISERTFLPADTAVTWPGLVPFFFSGPTLYAATLVRALIATGRESLVSRLRLDRLYAACLVFTPEYRSRVDDARTRGGGSVSSLALTRAVCWIWWQRAKALMANVLRKLTRRLGRRSRAVGLRDIGEVVAYLAESLAGISLPPETSARKTSFRPHRQ